MANLHLIGRENVLLSILHCYNKRQRSAINYRTVLANTIIAFSIVIRNTDRLCVLNVTTSNIFQRF